RTRQMGEQQMSAIRAGSATDIGQVRSKNQDAVLAGERLFVVADGFGGAGEVASCIALQTIAEVFGATPTPGGLAEACSAANLAVLQRAEGDPDLTGMGTTVAAIGVVRTESTEQLALANVGDSRVYLLRQGELSPMTEDHSVVADLVRAGEITKKEARVHEERSILTRALGVGRVVRPDTSQLTPRDGDRFLLCTDGLGNELVDDEIASILGSTPDPARAAEQLVRAASEHGGADNTSVIVVDVVGATA
ncbi:MAG: PP2C family protein-serine/threonine phosphatase, partial [Acidimicrobiales bacterium]